MKKKLFLILLAITVAVISFMVLEKITPKEIDDYKPNANKEIVISFYYVPVTHFFSEIENLSESEVAEKNILILKKDEDYLKEIFTRSNFQTFGSQQELIRNLKVDSIAILPWDEVPPQVKSISYNGSYLWEEKDLDNYRLKAPKKISASEAKELEFDPQKILKLNFLGDVMLSRTVNSQIQRYGYNYPWLKVSKKISDADLTFANLEVPISDLYPPPSSGMSFIAPEKNLDYIKGAGIDIVSVANNHSANFGKNVFLDNLQNLENKNIKVCGGGKNLEEALSPVIIDIKGLKVGFVCTSSIIGSLYADENSPGVPFLGLEPWYRDDKSSREIVADAIKKSQKEADITIVSPHWGVEYVHSPNQSQREAGREFLEAGADLVIGTHPHVVQGVEAVDGKNIFYSLGNFIFDQEWSRETKEGLMVSSYFYESKYLGSKLSPLVISNYAQPEFVSGAAWQRIIGDIKNASLGFSN